ncbi:MAG: hypothetical protein VCA74_05195 [Deltaproteobacteria bacterium]
MTVLALGSGASGQPAAAFFQKTSLGGTLGTDISGIWLVVAHMAPSFRVRVERQGDEVLPLEVAAIPAPLAAVAGDPPRGVVISGFTDPKASGRYSIFVGDIITKVNSIEISGVQEYHKALGGVKKYALIMIRRPMLQSTKARLLKIDYRATEKEVDGTSVIGNEDLNIRVLDGVLPFADELAASHRTHELWNPTAADIATLGSSWYKLAAPEKAVFVGGTHEVVARGSYDGTKRKDVSLSGTLFAVVSKLDGNPMTGGGSNISVYGVKEVSVSKMSGNYVESTLASAPFPISVDFNGTFSMFRIDEFSHKDTEFRKARVRDKARQEYGKVRLAPDIPAAH